MIRPAFELARAKPAYRNYIKAFGYYLTVSEDSAALKAAEQGGGGESGVALGQLLHQALPQLNTPVLKQRLDFAVRLCSSAIYAHARGPNAFRGKQADFFIKGLIDALVGLLTGPRSSGD